MKRTLFNDKWKFCVGTGTSMDNLLGIGSEAVPVSVTLPHDAMILTEREDSREGASLGFYKGTNYHYTKEFEIEEKDSDKVVWIDFEGIYQDAFVYLNDSFVGRCNYGYGNYYLELTNFIKYGKKNKLVVVVKNEGRSGRWYTGGGIYRDVHLMIGNQLHIACEGTKVTAKDIESDLAVIYTETPLEYVASKPVVCYVENNIYDSKGNLIASDKSPITLLRHETQIMSQTLYVKDPILWDLDNPYLYTCQTKLWVDDELLDESETTFGIRKLQLDVMHGLRINGKVVKFRGGCVHHDNGVIGTATFAQAEYRRVKKLKDAGFNALRSGSTPMSKAMLEACDRLGMLVVDEFTDVFNNIKVDFDYGCRFDLFWKLDLSNMIKRDYNHPSIVMYSLGCENPQVGDRMDKRLVKQMCDVVREIDRTRYISLDVTMTMIMLKYVDDIFEQPTIDSNAEVNSTMNSFGDMLKVLYAHPLSDYVTEEALAQLDVVGYNYVTDRYEHDHEKFPNRILMASECTGRDLATNWPYIQNCPYVLGDFCWAAWDYVGEAGVGRAGYEAFGPTDFYAKWPWRLADCGSLNIIGDRNTMSYWREMIWGLRTTPYIAVRDPKHYGEKIYATEWGWISDAYANWTWPGYENKPITVEVLTCAEEVELFVNGASVGKQKPGKELQNCAIFETIYVPGEIKAVASNGEEFILKTAKSDSEIELQVEGTELKAGANEIAFIEISMCDEDGILNCSSDKKVCVEVEGAGTLQGFGSADPKSLENYFDNVFTPYHGRLLAVVRSGVEPGDMTVKISAKDCETKMIKIPVI